MLSIIVCVMGTKNLLECWKKGKIYERGSNEFVRKFGWIINPKKNCFQSKGGSIMKIYFEDGKLLNFDKLPVIPDYIVEAGHGISNNIKLLDSIYNNDQHDSVTYTNSICALSNEYAWNDSLKLPEIYLRDNNGKFKNITLFTNRKLRQGYNLAKMYISGEFN